MRELVGDDDLRQVDAVQGPGAERRERAGGDERRVLHPAGANRLVRRIDDGQRAVRVAAIGQAVGGDRAHRRPQVALRLRQVIGPHQQPHLDVAEAQLLDRSPEPRRGVAVVLRGHFLGRVEAARDLDEARRRGPGEVVDVALLVGVGGRAVAVVHARGAHAGGADHEAPRQRDGDAVVAEVGVELRVGVELVRAPAAGGAAAHAGRLVDGDLREPLPDQEVVAGVAGAGVGLGQHRRERELELDAAARRDGLRQPDPRQRAVLAVAVVGRLERQRRQQVGAGRDPQRPDLDAAPAVVGHRHVAELAARFAEERAVAIAEGVQVEMEPEIRDAVGRRIAPGETQGAVETLRLRVEPDGDVVVGGARRVRRQGIGVAAGRGGQQGLARDQRGDEESASRPADHVRQSRFRIRPASGGSVSTRDCAMPCAAIGSVSSMPALPTLLPP